jgi:solute carrier family 25 carnitine/acylcarnitine transporter 20/29
MACWLPVYPIDVVKTRMQNTKGGKANASEGLSVNAISVAIVMYRTEGIGAFFNGLVILLLRAAISNGVTFWIYDMIMCMLGCKI